MFDMVGDQNFLWWEEGLFSPSEAGSLVSHREHALGWPSHTYGGLSESLALRLTASMGLTARVGKFLVLDLHPADHMVPSSPALSSCCVVLFYTSNLLAPFRLLPF